MLPVKPFSYPINVPLTNRSWDSMSHFLAECFGDITFETNEPEEVMTTSVSYVDEIDGKKLLSHVAMPDTTIWQTPSPAVVILP